MKHFNKRGPICYVKQPSNCTDLQGSTVEGGRQYSWEACKNQGRTSIDFYIFVVPKFFICV